MKAWAMSRWRVGVFVMVMGLTGAGCAGHIQLAPQAGLSRDALEQAAAECREPSAIWLRWPTVQQHEAACLIAKGHQTPVGYAFRTSSITTARMGVLVTATAQSLPAPGEVLAALEACEGELLARTVPATEVGYDSVDGMLMLSGLPAVQLGEFASRARNSVVLYGQCMTPRGYRVEVRR